MERIDKLDDKDLALLRILQNNSKKTIKELAAEVNLSPTPVFEDWKKTVISKDIPS